MILFSGCAGYTVRNNFNPFKEYGISSITVPTFYNKSIVADFTPALTREFILMLNKYPGLTVYSGNNQNADAVLVGVLYSGKHRSSVYTNLQDRITDGRLKQSIGDREAFNVPYKLGYNMNLVVYLIKRPTKEEIELLQTGLNEEILAKHSKVVMSNNIPIYYTYARVNYSNISPDDGGIVNLTQNRAILKKNMDDKAAIIANRFKELVINAF